MLEFTDKTPVISDLDRVTRWSVIQTLTGQTIPPRVSDKLDIIPSRPNIP